MIRSKSEALGEYDLLRRPEHVTNVWGAIESTLPRYWEKFVEAEQQSDPIAKLSAKWGHPKTAEEGAILAQVFEKAVDSYETAAQKYRRFFDPEAIEEFHDDPNAFKQGLSRDVPIIANTLRQRHAELKDWQMHFRSARSNDLLEVFSNVLDFREEWSSSHPLDTYEGIDDPDAFGLNPLDTDETMGMLGVIGMGIKSITLYHLDPARLPARNRNGLYGLYFLSGRGDFGMPSQSSEFLMINDDAPVSDGSIIMDQNYWYPYTVFSLYALRVFKWIRQRASTAAYTLDRSLRFVYVARFLDAVCDQHAEDLKTMRAHERFEVPA